MRITRELIEKYHEGNCTPEEMKAVENWLLDDDADQEFVLPNAESKEKIQDEIWNAINPSAPAPEKLIRPTFLDSNPFWRPAVAAAAILVLGFTLFNIKYPAFNSEVIVLKNASDTFNKDVNESRYTISLGPKSNIEINNNTGSIDFCGAVMINPKEDIEFTIQGTCVNPTEQKETMTLKKGLNYIALNYSSHENDSEMIILEEGALMGLPPQVQRQLMSQFNI
jgi:hypothetical protein